MAPAITFAFHVAVRPRALLVLAARALFAVIAAITAISAAAQDRLADADNAPPSPLAPVLERLDGELRSASIGSDDAEGRWIAGQLERLDIEAEARDYAAAQARAPGEMLYAASLARTCTHRVRPGLPECDARDALGYWAARDPSNAAPWLLLAERARQRGSSAAILENLERAARLARFTDYSERSAGVFAAKLAVLPGGNDPGVAAVAAAHYADASAGSFRPILAALCGPRRDPKSDVVTGACIRVAALLVDAAPSGADKMLGAEIAAGLVASESARGIVESRARDIATGRERCKETLARLETLVANPATVTPATARAAQAWLVDRGKMDEITACARLRSAISLP
jgi:hypothetical protein